MKKAMIKIYIHKKNGEDKQLYARIYKCIYLYFIESNENGEKEKASAGILQCKWVFDRKVRDMMQFNVRR